jgi:hypothetical protein
MVHRSEMELGCSKEEVYGSYAKNELEDTIMYPLFVLDFF